VSAGLLPLFHLYGDPPDDQAFDFIHIETIASRSSIHNWNIGTHRHRNLFQILLVERGGGEMGFETVSIGFGAPCLILVPATIAHGFRFWPTETDGWVVTFTEDVAETIGDRRREYLGQLRTLATDPVVLLRESELSPLLAHAIKLHEEHSLARAGFQIAMRGLLALITVEVARLAIARGKTSIEPLALDATVATVDMLRKLIEQHFRAERRVAFYADKLVMTIDRLNDHVRRATGVTAGHLIRQRLLAEAKRQLVFTHQPIHEIAYDLSFCDSSHFGRFFHQYTGVAPHQFRATRGG
jgi:AraC family transcriptional regulator, transcriptional activator of pobA